MESRIGRDRNNGQQDKQSWCRQGLSQTQSRAGRSQGKDRGATQGRSASGRMLTRSMSPETYHMVWKAVERYVRK